MAEFWCFEGQKCHFHAVSCDYCIFPIFKIFIFGLFKKCSRVIFRVPYEKQTQKYASHRQNPKFSIWTFLDLVTMNDRDLEYASQKLRMIRRSVPDTIHVVGIDLFPFHTALVRDKPRYSKSSNIFTLTWPMTSSVTPRSTTLGFPSRIFQIYRTPFEFCKSD